MNNRILIVGLLFFANLVCINLNGMFRGTDEKDMRGHRRDISYGEPLGILNFFIKNIKNAEKTGILKLDYSEELYKEKSVDGLSDDELNDIWNLILKANKIKPITQLSLKNNNLTLVPDKIVELKGLEVLDLRNNSKLETLPECLGEMENLKTIHIAGTEIQLLPLSDEIRGKCSADDF